VQVVLSSFRLRVIFQLFSIDREDILNTMQDLIKTQDMILQSIDLTFMIMESKNLIQYGSRSGITSDGSKIEYMSCYKMLLTIQNKPSKHEYVIKTEIQ
jgi:hypothetical protein